MATVRIREGERIVDAITLRLDDSAQIDALHERLEARYNGRTPAKADLVDKLLGLLDELGRPATEATGPDDRPVVDVSGGNLRAQTAVAWEALRQTNDPPAIFSYAGLTARIGRDEAGGEAIAVLDADAFGYEFCERVRTVRVSERGVVDVYPPQPLLRNMRAIPRLPLPEVRGLVTVPVVGRNGSLIERPGYHPASGLYYSPTPGLVVPPVPARPSGDDVREARRLLEGELLAEFPFEGDADRTGAVAMIVERFARELIDGPTPMAGIEAPAAGTGKGLLVAAAAMPMVGRALALTALPRSEEEVRKKISALVKEAAIMAVFDNLREALTSSTLAAAITATVWEDRLLGETRMLRAPMRLGWVYTANNPTVSREMSRRVMPIRLNARVERPWERTGFRHPDLLAWAQAQRGHLIWSVLVLVEAWLEAGRPAGEVSLGSFEEWSKVVGGILHNAGLPGFLANRHTFYSRADQETDAWQSLVARWWAAHGAAKVTSAELLVIAQAIGDFDLGGKDSEQGQCVALGKALARKEDCVVDGKQIVRAGKARKGAVQWRLVDQTGAEGAEDAEAGTPPSASAQGQRGSVQAPIHACAPLDSAEDAEDAEGAEALSAPIISSQGLDEASQGAAQAAEDLAADRKIVPHAARAATLGTLGTLGVESPLYMLTEAADVREVVPVLMAAPWLGFDMETTGLDPHSHTLRLIQLASADAVYVVDTWAADARALRPLFEVTEGPVLVGHNLKFETAFLMAAGLPVPPTERLFDTMIAAQLLAAGGPDFGRASLQDVAARVLGLVMDKELQTSDWSGALSQDQVRYAALDAVVPARLMARQRPELEADDLGRVMALEMGCLPAVAWLERTGAPFDRTAWRILAEGAQDRLTDVDARLDALCGERDLFGPRGPKWSSAMQVLRVLRERGHAIRDAREETLRHLVAEGEPLARPLLERREAAKQKGTYGLDYLRYVHPLTGRIHATYWQLGSVAGRFACSGPNLQQVPHDPRYRSCFRPDPGRVLVKADYSQIELRLAAQLARDKRMIEALGQGLDLHTLTAQTVLGKADVTADDRRAAKSVNFGLLYGMGAAGLREYAANRYGVYLSQEEAERVRGRFFATHKGLRAWHRAQPSNGVSMTTRTVLGRRRLNVSKFTEKLNSPVQGAGSDGLKLGLGLLWQRRQQCPDATPILNVHDEVVIEVDATRADEAREWLVGCLRDGMAQVLTEVPVVVEAIICRDWSGAQGAAEGGAP
jgi:DNA polymerase-1